MPEFKPTRAGVRALTAYINKHGKGTTVYTVAETRDWGIGAERLYNDHTFTHRSWGTCNWTTGHYSPESLLSNRGTVYTEPPRGARYIGDPAPQVAGPLGHGEYEGILDQDELRSLKKHLRSASHPSARRI
jgi:hypothetical protein